jgi:hypothetical protein
LTAPRGCRRCSRRQAHGPPPPRRRRSPTDRPHVPQERRRHRDRNAHGSRACDRPSTPAAGPRRNRRSNALRRGSVTCASTATRGTTTQFGPPPERSRRGATHAARRVRCRLERVRCVGGDRLSCRRKRTPRRRKCRPATLRARERQETDDSKTTPNRSALGARHKDRRPRNAPRDHTPRRFPPYIVFPPIPAAVRRDAHFLHRLTAPSCSCSSYRPLVAAPPPALHLHAWAALPHLSGRSRKGRPARSGGRPFLESPGVMRVIGPEAGRRRGSPKGEPSRTNH